MEGFGLGLGNRKQRHTGLEIDDDIMMLNEGVWRGW